MPLSSSESELESVTEFSGGPGGTVLLLAAPLVRRAGKLHGHHGHTEGSRPCALTAGPIALTVHLCKIIRSKAVTTFIRGWRGFHGNQLHVSEFLEVLLCSAILLPHAASVHAGGRCWSGESWAAAAPQSLRAGAGAGAPGYVFLAKGIENGSAFC